MRTRFILTALLAAPLLAGAADPFPDIQLAQDEVLRIEGIWEIDPAAPPDHERRCDEHPLRIEISENGDRYYSESIGLPGSGVRSAILAKRDLPGDRFMIHLQYENEARLDPAGDLVSWWLVSVDAGEFYWIRDDWTSPGQRTASRFRCQTLIS